MEKRDKHGTVEVVMWGREADNKTFIAHDEEVFWRRERTSILVELFETVVIIRLTW